MSNQSLNELDILLGLPKPVEEMTDKELEKFLLRHFPHTRPTGTDLASLLNDPLLKGIDVQAIINQTQNFKFKKYSLKLLGALQAVLAIGFRNGFP